MRRGRTAEGAPFRSVLSVFYLIFFPVSDRNSIWRNRHSFRALLIHSLHPTSTPLLLLLLYVAADQLPARPNVLLFFLLLLFLFLSNRVAVADFLPHVARRVWPAGTQYSRVAKLYTWSTILFVRSVRFVQITTKPGSAAVLFTSCYCDRRRVPPITNYRTHARAHTLACSI